MQKKARAILVKIFWPAFVLTLAASLVVVLWSGREEVDSYQEMACAFENKDPHCLDTIADWRQGLSAYDSILNATGDTLLSLKKLLWEFWNIEFAGAGEAAVAQESILPLEVLKNRKSGCVGLSWLALMVAEKKHIPLNAILLPGHMFLQYGCDGDGVCVNLEPNRQGFSYTDEEYKEKYKAGPWTGFEYKPLSQKQVFGLAAFNMGNTYLNNDIHHALTWYRMAEEFFPEYPGIKANQTVAKSRL